MRSLSGMTRAVVLLIILRMVAAPVAARPDTPRPQHSQHRFVVRLCTWPAQGAQAVCAPVPRSGEGPPDSGPNLVVDDRRRDTRASTIEHLSRLALRDGSPVHLSDCPRC